MEIIFIQTTKRCRRKRRKVEPVICESSFNDDILEKQVTSLSCLNHRPYFFFFFVLLTIFYFHSRPNISTLWCKKENISCLCWSKEFHPVFLCTESMILQDSNGRIKSVTQGRILNPFAPKVPVLLTYKQRL